VTNLSQSGCPNLDELAKKCGQQWPTITKAAMGAQMERSNLANRLSESDPKLISPDTSVVVFGSLARGEWTQGSDRDWTLLIDGQVEVQHADVVTKIVDAFDVDGRRPGPTGVFGGLTFSNNIVHFIGGDDDSNTNTTRRILLLLESKSLDGNDLVRSRVLRALLERYVGEDLLYHEPSKFRVPRFLLNDYVRYWRTMAVDSAQKRRERAKKWALRNIKLRLSRKLIFVAGLWACLSCELHPSTKLKVAREANDATGVRQEMTSFLVGFSSQSPLETLASVFLKYEAWDAAKMSFDAYENFLEILDSEPLRTGLENLTFSNAVSDKVFQRGKKAAHDFQEGLTSLFFRKNEELREATQIYGVF
jgi:hypothetical protein